jgi:hypothetical protein
VILNPAWKIHRPCDDQADTSLDSRCAETIRIAVGRILAAADCILGTTLLSATWVEEDKRKKWVALRRGIFDDKKEGGSCNLFRNRQQGGVCFSHDIAKPLYLPL